MLPWLPRYSTCELRSWSLSLIAEDLPGHDAGPPCSVPVAASPWTTPAFKHAANCCVAPGALRKSRTHTSPSV